MRDLSDGFFAAALGRKKAQIGPTKKHRNLNRLGAAKPNKNSLKKKYVGSAHSVRTSNHETLE